MSAHERRSKNKAADDEDASQLNLGTDFAQDVMCLSISEVRDVLDMIEAKRQRVKPNETPVYKKTVDYVALFARFASKEINESVREVLDKAGNLEDFEKMQIVNLCPLESEEAKALIPSLQKLDDEELQEMLTEIASLRRLQ